MRFLISGEEVSEREIDKRTELVVSFVVYYEIRQTVLVINAQLSVTSPRDLLSELRQI